MTTTARRNLLAIVTAIVLLGVGVGIGIVVDDGARAPVEVPAAVAERDTVMTWLARGLLLLSALWILIGAVASRTRLVRRPGAAAARASWLGATR
ncbi:MAG TPA: hypothetical protein VNP97_06125, partial [Microbacterium sp.]|nr:hypothetical protein [Microbacterium sp.]